MLFSNWCLLGDNDNLAWTASGFGQPRTIAKQTLNAVGHIKGFNIRKCYCDSVYVYLSDICRFRTIKLSSKAKSFDSLNVMPL